MSEPTRPDVTLPPPGWYATQSQNRHQPWSCEKIHAVTGSHGSEAEAIRDAWERHDSELAKADDLRAEVERLTAELDSSQAAYAHICDAIHPGAGPGGAAAMAISVKILIKHRDEKAEALATVVRLRKALAEVVRLDDEYVTEHAIEPETTPPWIPDKTRALLGEAPPKTDATEWRPIPDTDGLYEVTLDGRVRSWKPWHSNPVPREMTVQNPKHGRRTIQLGQRSSARSVDELVASAFGENPPTETTDGTTSGKPVEGPVPPHGVTLGVTEHEFAADAMKRMRDDD